jgi:hypothetical protein
MKTQSNGRFLSAAMLLGSAVAIGIHFMARTPEKHEAQPVAVAALEPLRLEQTASKSNTALRPAILQLLDPSTPARTRIDLAMACDRDLNNDEIMALLAEVSTPPAAAVDAGWHSQYLHEICLQLHHHSSIRSKFARVLVQISTDAGRAQVEREYAVQHLRGIWRRAVDDNTLRQSVAAHFKNLIDHNPELAGPALLSLHFLGNDPARQWNGSGAIFANHEIEPLVSKLLKQSRDKEAPGGVMAALRVAGDRSLPGPLPSIRQVAADTSVTAIVRMAAVSIIASSGNDSAAFLQSIDQGDPLVDQAIRLSLKKTR